jgi:mRNA interferase RelE/StbE
MTYEILFTQSAKKELEKLEKTSQERIMTALERIRVRPERFVRKLVGDRGYRLRVGDYRVIIDICQDKLVILVIKIGHRKNVYNED